MFIRETIEIDLEDILNIHRDAFDTDEEAMLTNSLLGDPSAEPVLSLIAFEKDIARGHILFTRARIKGSVKNTLVYILAPLAVVSSSQNKGIGTRLITRGIELLEDQGASLVFVLGHQDYYPRFGFSPALRHGLEAPFPIPAKHADAWMVQELKFGALDTTFGMVECADVLNQEKYWRE